MFKQALWVSTLIAAATFAGQAQALQMTLTSNDGGSVNVIDEVFGSDQTYGLEGIVSYTGLVGSNFIFTASFGTSKPILSDGTTGGAALHLSSLVITSSNAGTLTITLEDDGFAGGGLTELLFGIGGVSSGQVSAVAYVDNSNTTGVLGGQIANLGPLGGNPFAASAGYIANTSASYGLGIVAQINHSAGVNITSFDSEIRIAEPATLGLFGLGLAALGVAARRRKLS